MQSKKRSTNCILSVFMPVFMLTTTINAATTINQANNQDHKLQIIYNSLVFNHYCPQTGLFISFYNTGDKKICQQSSTYDQGALGLLLLEIGDTQKAEKMVSFFAKEWESAPYRDNRNGTKGLSNFYNAVYGGEGIEKTIHVGPNAWLGLFAARYVRKTQDARYWPFVRDMAYWIGKGINHSGGGVAMGPVDGDDGVPWTMVFSTENNLSYYAFLSELEKNSFATKRDREFFAKEKAGVEKWLLNLAYDKSTKCMNRGENPAGIDTIRALDTHTWLVSALGPERLRNIGFDPYEILGLAESKFETTVGSIRGVDFTDAQEAARVVTNGDERPQTDNHRLLWLEGLGQYIAAIGLASHYAGANDINKGNELLLKTKSLISEFDKTAFEPGNGKTGYPYAFPQAGRTFHDGWYVPKPGAGGYACALIASVWRSFAELGFDPMADIYYLPGGKIKETVSLWEPNKKTVNEPILYGSSCDMVNRAWELLDEGRYPESVRQAQATVDEWRKFADDLEFKKEHVEGQLIDYDGNASSKRSIFSYWALNDVGAALYIIAKANHQQGDIPNSRDAISKLINKYRLAQVWDPKGWFWAPIEAIREEFINYETKDYGDLALLFEQPEEPKLAQATK